MPTVGSFRPSQLNSSEEDSTYFPETLPVLDFIFDEKHNIFDKSPPLLETLSAKFKRSFAYKTIKERVPKILCDVINCLKEHELKIMEQCGSYARYDIRRVIWSLDILLSEVIQNRPFKMFYDKDPHAKDWNAFINRQRERERNQWFSADWLIAECYLYRRIWSAFRREKTLRDYDYFGPKKICATRNLVYLMDNMLQATNGLARSQKNLQLILKLSLWSNRCDLSINKDNPDADKFINIDENDEDLLADQSIDVWRLLTESNKPSSNDAPILVDIVCDNAGFELFMDLVMANYLLETGLAKKVRFHVKAIPWFVSDVTENDFKWMLRFLRRHEKPLFSTFGRKLRNLMRNRNLQLYETCHFWTRPHGFRHMSKLAPCLYVQLSLGFLVIFKGDLNYRKLLDDINYAPTTPFKDCLGGFLPTSVCALRCIKSDLYCGLPVCTVEWLTKNNPRWMITGQNAVIQLAVKQRP